MNILRTREVIRRTGLSRTTIWRLQRSRLFPIRRKLGANSVGWLEGDIERWIASRPNAVSATGRAPGSSRGG